MQTEEQNPTTQTEQTSNPTTETSDQPSAPSQPEQDTSTILTSETAKADGEKAEGEKTETETTTTEDTVYEIAVKDAEGNPVALDKELVDALTPMAREMGWGNDQASKVAQFYNDTVMPKLESAFQAQLAEGVQAQRTEWANEAKASISTDPVYDGKKLEDVLPVSAKAIDALGGTDFRTFLDETGLGNHPALLKVMYQVGKAMTEDGFDLSNTSAAPRPLTREEKYYPKK